MTTTHAERASSSAPQTPTTPQSFQNLTACQGWTRVPYRQAQISHLNLTWQSWNCRLGSLSAMMSEFSLHRGQLRQGGVFSRHWHFLKCSLHMQNGEFPKWQNSNLVELQIGIVWTLALPQVQPTHAKRQIPQMAKYQPGKNCEVAKWQIMH